MQSDKFVRDHWILLVTTLFMISQFRNVFYIVLGCHMNFYLIVVILYWHIHT